MIQFGWFQSDVDQPAVEIESQRKLPCSWQRTQTNEDSIFEGIIPLENRMSAWLFGELDKNGLWEVTVHLWLPCPIHPREIESRRCEYPALRVDETTVTNPLNCAGSSCASCTHAPARQCIDADPGAADELYETLAEWSGYTWQPRDVAPHQDFYDFAIEHNIPA